MSLAHLSSRSLTEMLSNMLLLLDPDPLEPSSRKSERSLARLSMVTCVTGGLLG